MSKQERPESSMKPRPKDYGNLSPFMQNLIDAGIEGEIRSSQGSALFPDVNPGNGSRAGETSGSVAPEIKAGNDGIETEFREPEPERPNPEPAAASFMSPPYQRVKSSSTPGTDFLRASQTSVPETLQSKQLMPEKPFLTKPYEPPPRGSNNRKPKQSLMSQVKADQIAAIEEAQREGWIREEHAVQYLKELKGE